MNINDVITAISTLGFPIVCCAALFWQNVRTAEQHKVEMDGMREALQNNTIVMTEIRDTLRELSEEREE